MADYICTNCQQSFPHFPRIDQIRRFLRINGWHQKEFINLNEGLEAWRKEFKDKNQLHTIYLSTKMSNSWNYKHKAFHKLSSLHGIPFLKLLRIIGKL